MGTYILTKSFTIHYWLKKIQFTHELSFLASGQMSHMKYSILCCKDIIHRFLRFVNANAKILYFQLFHEYSLFSVKIHFWSENSVERGENLIFVKMHNFGLGYLSH